MTTCLINQNACGRTAGNPVCPKCGMDQRVVYPGQADREAAQERAEGAFWKSHALGLQRDLDMEEKASSYWKSLANELQHNLDMEDKATSYWKKLAMDLQHQSGVPQKAGGVGMRGDKA